MSDSESRPRRVELKRKALERYRQIAGDDAIAEIRDLAKELRGLRVLELSATATGGGVAELLLSLVPLQRDVGIDAEWHIIAGDPEFFEITKTLHNALQGGEVELGEAERQAYLRHNEANAKAMENGWDAVIVHDPQPAAMRSFLPEASGRWAWRCHIDTPEPHQPVWDFVRPFCESHDLAAFTLDSFVPPDLDMPTCVILPAIDPLTSKNRPLPDYLARETVAELGIDLTRPLMVQVSRFDPWKDPLGVVEVWKKAREEFPSLQLALVGSMAADDPEGWRIYTEVEHEMRGEDGGFLFTDQMGVSHHEVNALQRVADVVVQKSLREGFGLIVSETLWKGTAMVAGGVGGIPSQLVDGEGGYLADGADEFAERVVDLLRHPAEAARLGQAGHERVRERFLLPRLLRDQIQMLRDLVEGGGTAAAESADDGAEAEGRAELTAA